MSELPIFNEVIVQGVPAQATFSFALQQKVRPSETVSVRSAEDADRALGDDGNEHHCPLCNEFYGTEAFKAHAPECIRVRAPRRRVWTPPGVSNALAVFSDRRGGV